MELFEPLISNTLYAFVKLTPLQVLAGIAGVGLVLSYLSRSKDTLVVTLSALIYAVPFLMVLAGRR